MNKDILTCPFCHLLHKEEFLEPLICSSFICERCEGKVRVKINPNGYIVLFKRLDRMWHLTRKTTQAEDFKYLDQIRKKYIMRVKRSHNEDLLEEFFKHGKRGWITKTRAMLCQEASMAGITITTIKEYFKFNNGTINYRTVRAYKNKYD